MSATHPGFQALVKSIKKALIKGSADKVRRDKAKNVQLIPIDANEIYSEITTIYSPFKIEGELWPDSTLRQISKDIERDLWNLFKTKSRGTHFKVGQEIAFMAAPGVAFLFDDSKKFIYARSGAGNNNVEVFRANAMQIVQDFVRSSREPNDVTGMFINPNPKYVRAKSKLEFKLRKAFYNWKEYPRFRDHKDGKSAVTNKLQAIRNPKKGDKFAHYPKHYWSSKFQKIKVKYPGQGVQLGHVFGGQVTTAAGVVVNKENVLNAATYEDIELVGTTPATFDSTALKKGIFAVAETDANVVLKRGIYHNDIFGELTIIIPELGDKNAKSGADAKDIFNKHVVPELKALKIAIEDIEGSPSLNQLVNEYIENTFHDKKIRRKVHTTRAKIKVKSRGGVNVNRLHIKGGQIRTRKVTKRIKVNNDGSYNLQSLMAFLNKKLKDKIIQNMGKGNSKAVLNNRTGTFAGSAKIKQLLPSTEKNAINAKVKYQKNPYDVFEPGESYLATPGRNPARIFGRSIRQLLQEEKITTLRRVKVDLVG